MGGFAPQTPRDLLVDMFKNDKRRSDETSNERRLLRVRRKNDQYTSIERRALPISSATDSMFSP